MARTTLGLENPEIGLRPNLQRMIIIMLPICTQRLTEFEIMVYDIFDFFELIWTQNFSTNAWTSLELGNHEVDFAQTFWEKLLLRYL